MHLRQLFFRRGVQALRSDSRVAWAVSPRSGSVNANPPAVWTRSYTRPGTAQAAPALVFSPASQQCRHSSSHSSSAPSLPVLPPSILAQALLPTASAPTASASLTSSSKLPSADAAAPVATVATADATNAHPTVYATVLLHGRPYLVTPGDQLRLPFRMPDVRPGDELLLDRVGVIGSRTLTAVPAVAGGRTTTQGGPLVQHQGYVPGAAVRAVVLGVEAEPLREMIKTKRRNRRNRRVRSKHQYTVLRIQEVMLSSEAAQAPAAAA